MHVIIGKGYLKFVKAKGKIYVYLFGRLENETQKSTLFKFGEINMARELMYQMRDDTKLPQCLQALGLDYDDLDEWILTLETRLTRTGKLVRMLSVN